MTDHAVFVPTSEGPMGGIVSEPRGPVRAGLILLAGYGRPARSGTNSFWTRLAREMTEQGLVVLRVDYAKVGETIPVGERTLPGYEDRGPQIAKHALEMHLLDQVVDWFLERLGGGDLYLAGACSGARLAIDLAGGEHRSMVSGTFLVVPYLHSLPDPRDSRQGSRDGDLDAPEAVDSAVVQHMRAILARSPSWMVFGESDALDVNQLERRLGPTPHKLELEMVPGMALHFLDQPDVQEQARSRMMHRIARALVDADGEFGHTHSGESTGR